jgi:hypothetical protein
MMVVKCFDMLVYKITISEEHILACSLTLKCETIVLTRKINNTELLVISHNMMPQNTSTVSIYIPLSSVEVCLITVRVES